MMNYNLYPRNYGYVPPPRFEAPAPRFGEMPRRARGWWDVDDDIYKSDSLVSNLDGQTGFPKDKIENLSFDKLDCICTICQEVFRDPVAVECGHTFCTTCIKLALKSNQRCPSCMKSIPATTTPIFCLKKYIDTLNIKCPEQDCIWTGTIETLRIHEKECKFSTLPYQCPQCRETIKRINIDKHKNDECIYRLISCDFCNNKIKCVELEMHLTSLCKKRQYECRKCREIIILDERVKHDRVCPARYVMCSICQYSFVQPELEEHLIQCMKDGYKSLSLSKDKVLAIEYKPCGLQKILESDYMKGCMICDIAVQASNWTQHCEEVHGEKSEKRLKKSKKQQYDR